MFRCPICRCTMAREELGSTKFERATEIVRCEECAYELPLEAVEHLPRWTERRILLAVDSVTRGAAQLRSLTVRTRTDCPYCLERLNYRVGPQFVECDDCGYQEHWPRERVHGLMA